MEKYWGDKAELLINVHIWWGLEDSSSTFLGIVKYIILEDRIS